MHSGGPNETKETDTLLQNEWRQTDKDSNIGKVEGNRPRGRPAKRWSHDIVEWFGWLVTVTGGGNSWVASCKEEEKDIHYRELTSCVHYVKKPWSRQAYRELRVLMKSYYHVDDLHHRRHLVRGQTCCIQLNNTHSSQLDSHKSHFECSIWTWNTVQVSIVIIDSHSNLRSERVWPQSFTEAQGIMGYMKKMRYNDYTTVYSPALNVHINSMKNSHSSITKCFHGDLRWLDLTCIDTENGSVQ